ncbi:TetR/AcrR family transcriptional regulator [Dyella sp. GSA-30]|uniref:TetR/AcrR family transcriptional regulator n=1 Tax=Dyella sp. GSA-30 TaxID=2994496 RepID=UPI00248FB66E|nr:TetR/AcrR family transcriptional regulator [Dyella sp. GSA-30]BDU19466.1 TetR family transcriptional regulator [Dyella sp. GSA-30]
MPSQKSNAPAAEAARPAKRERGRLRVAAILEAGAQVFAEKGYEAATMTEIAARAETAIGSLYRFFPSKESLADALLESYADLAVASLTTMQSQAATWTSRQLADALVDFVLALQNKRQFVLALLDARAGDRRLLFRASMRAGIAAILRSAMPSLTSAKAETMAPVLIEVLKSVAALSSTERKSSQRWLGELRDLVQAYLDQAAVER